MPSYNSERFEFTIDGTTHSLPELTIDMLEEISELYAKEQGNNVKLVKMFREVMISKAEDDGSREAIAKLGAKNLGAMFRDWTGTGSGEA